MLLSKYAVSQRAGMSGSTSEFHLSCAHVPEDPSDFACSSTLFLIMAVSGFVVLRLLATLSRHMYAYSCLSVRLYRGAWSLLYACTARSNWSCVFFFIRNLSSISATGWQSAFFALHPYACIARSNWFQWFCVFFFIRNLSSVSATGWQSAFFALHLWQIQCSTI